jgi:glucokinase
MYYIGIDLGGTNIAVGITDEKGTVLCKGNISTGRERPYREIIKDMAQLTIQVMKDAGIEQKRVKSIGIGSPGTPDNTKGILVYANNLTSFVNVPLRTEMRKYIDLPVILDNDANCAALAESIAGAAKEVKNSVTITLGTGVGSGLVINGRVYSGFNNSASEMGHMVIIAGGEQCTCGRKGCWEAYASATALIEQTKKAVLKNPNSLINRFINGDMDRINAKTPFDAARQGDVTGKKIVNQYIRYIAEGLINVINIFAPEIIVIGGGVSKEGEYLLKPLRKMIAKDVYFKGEPATKLRTAQMGNDAGIVGAAMLGKD